MTTRSNAPPNAGRYPLTDQGQNPGRARFAYWTNAEESDTRRDSRYPDRTDLHEPVDVPSYWMPHVERAIRPNEAEYGTPRDSRSGVLFKRAAGGRGLIRQQPPVLSPDTSPFRFMNLVGAFTARPARSRTIVKRQRYQGQLPMRLQPFIKKPYPWADPTRGLP